MTIKLFFYILFVTFSLEFEAVTNLVLNDGSVNIANLLAFLLRLLEISFKLTIIFILLNNKKVNNKLSILLFSILTILILFWIAPIISNGIYLIRDLWSIGFVEEMVCGGVRDSSWWPNFQQKTAAFFRPSPDLYTTPFSKPFYAGFNIIMVYLIIRGSCALQMWEKGYLDFTEASFSATIYILIITFFHTG